MQMPAGRTLPDLLAEMAGRYPDRVFLIDGDRRVTYAEFRAEARRLARSFHALGVRRGDKVAILMGNRAEWLLVDFAVTMLGAALVALNTWWRQRELHHALHLSDTAVLVMADRYLKHDYIAELAGMAELPELRHVVCLGERQPPGALSYAALRELGDDVPDTVLDAACASVRPDDMAYLLFTSGSTARSKAVPLLHEGLIRNMHGIGERLHLTEKDRLLMVVSLFWSFGCANALLAMMTHGGSVVLQDSFDTARSLELIERERCTVLYAMPNMALAMQAHPDRAQPRPLLAAYRHHHAAIGEADGQHRRTRNDLLLRAHRGLRQQHGDGLQGIARNARAHQRHRAARHGDRDRRPGETHEACAWRNRRGPHPRLRHAWLLQGRGNHPHRH